MMIYFIEKTVHDSFLEHYGLLGLQTINSAIQEYVQQQKIYISSRSLLTHYHEQITYAFINHISFVFSLLMITRSRKRSIHSGGGDHE